ncbi:MAG: WYL domain-containing protein, partial [Daejeonella sp.]
MKKICCKISGKVLEINYHARYNQEKTERLVEPLGVFYSDNSWHLIA